MNKSHCNLGALVSLWLNEYHQSFFFDQTGRSQPEAALLSDYNAFRFSFKGGVRVSSCVLRVTGENGIGLKAQGMAKNSEIGMRVSSYGLRVAGKNGIGLKAQGIGSTLVDSVLLTRLPTFMLHQILRHISSSEFSFLL
jgi:hypothetical protein